MRTTLDDTDRHRLTCLAVHVDAIPRHQVLAVRRLGDS